VLFPFLSWVLFPLLLWLWVGGEYVTEAIQAPLPECPALPNPLVRYAQAVGVEVAGADPAGFRGVYEAAPLEHLQVLHDRRKRQVERSGEIGGRARRQAEPLDDGASCRIPEGLEYLIDARMVKH
jgi:hypothetical protein